LQAELAGKVLQQTCEFTGLLGPIIAIMTTVTCNACGNAWWGAKAYCPRCGSPVLPRSGKSRVWEVAGVIAALAAVVWLRIKATR